MALKFLAKGLLDRLSREVPCLCKVAPAKSDVHMEDVHRAGGIMAILGEGEAGVPVAQVCRTHGVSSATYYQWKSKYAGMSVNELRRVKELEAENARLKRLLADAELDQVIGRCDEGGVVFHDDLPLRVAQLELVAGRLRDALERRTAELLTLIRQA